jgi:hypothetical protein
MVQPPSPLSPLRIVQIFVGQIRNEIFYDSVMTNNPEIKVWIPPKPARKPEIKVYIQLYTPKVQDMKARIGLQPLKKSESEVFTTPQ